MSIPQARNVELARLIEQVANLLDTDQASVCRASVWREGAAALRAHPTPIEEILAAQGLAGLTQIPAIGPELAAMIVDVLETGRASVGVHLAGFCTSVDFHTDLISSRAPRWSTSEPPVALLLEMDRRYRDIVAAHGPRRRLAQRQARSSSETWLPILHADLAGWTFTALYSRAPLAHQLHHARDWVDVHFERGSVKGHATVLTALQGPLVHHRVVRDRDAASQRHYGLAIDAPAAEG